MSFTVVIPARYESTRLPGKPLLEIAGKPMIQHVVEKVQQSNASAIYVATDDERIKIVCESFGVNVYMTASEHQSGTDRIEEVVRLLNLEDDEIVINVQADEPMIPHAVINQLAENMAANSVAGICTLYETIKTIEQFKDPNVVKLVTDQHSMAMYFSRSPIPFPRESFERLDISSAPLKRHVGIYAYRVKVLHQYANWAVTVTESAEKLEQLRALYNGVKIHVAHCCEDIPAGVDTENDLQTIREIFK